ncbi:MAG: hypothetical protein ACTSVI_04975 [Promethearchaeota archaeon]
MEITVIDFSKDSTNPDGNYKEFDKYYSLLFSDDQWHPEDDELHYLIIEGNIDEINIKIPDTLYFSEVDNHVEFIFNEKPMQIVSITLYNVLHAPQFLECNYYLTLKTGSDYLEFNYLSLTIYSNKKFTLHVKAEDYKKRKADPFKGMKIISKYNADEKIKKVLRLLEKSTSKKIKRIHAKRK